VAAAASCDGVSSDLNVLVFWRRIVNAAANFARIEAVAATA
jgi:hypothetical protein